jgi:hypothetical protein
MTARPQPTKVAPWGRRRTCACSPRARSLTRASPPVRVLIRRGRQDPVVQEAGRRDRERQGKGLRRRAGGYGRRGRPVRQGGAHGYGRRSLLRHAAAHRGGVCAHASRKLQPRGRNRGVPAREPPSLHSRPARAQALRRHRPRLSVPPPRTPSPASFRPFCRRSAQAPALPLTRPRPPANPACTGPPEVDGGDSAAARPRGIRRAALPALGRRRMAAQRHRRCARPAQGPRVAGRTLRVRCRGGEQHHTPPGCASCGMLDAPSLQRFHTHQARSRRSAPPLAYTHVRRCPRVHQRRGSPLTSSLLPSTPSRSHPPKHPLPFARRVTASWCASSRR